jgi:tRNA(Ile)-lysidine synthase TilS/MesJ
MNLTFQGRFDTMPALLKMRKMPISIIRPLCAMCEADIKRYAELSHYEKQTKLCPYETDSQRTGVKELFSTAEKLNPQTRQSIWNALNRDGKLVESA